MEDDMKNVQLTRHHGQTVPELRLGPASDHEP
jgi:hypothetical protein